MASLSDLLAAPWKLRYGVSPEEKYRLAIQGGIPGAQPIHSEQDVEREERRASGYLFAKQHPTIAGAVQPLVDDLRTHVFRDDPRTVAAAQEGQRAAIGQSKVGPAVRSLTWRAATGGHFDSWDQASDFFFGSTPTQMAGR